jgi:hypothetical protein
VNTVPDFFINLQPLEKSPVNENTKPFPDPNSAAVANIFDSHCHLDRVYRFWAQRYKTFFNVTDALWHVRVEGFVKIARIGTVMIPDRQKTVRTVS